MRRCQPVAQRGLVARCRPWPAGAQAQVPVRMPCYSYAEVARQLKGDLRTRPRSRSGLQADGNLLQVFSSAATGSWTIVSTSPARYGLRARRRPALGERHHAGEPRSGRLTTRGLTPASRTDRSTARRRASHDGGRAAPAGAGDEAVAAGACPRLPCRGRPSADRAWGRGDRHVARGHPLGRAWLIEEAGPHDRLRRARARLRHRVWRPRRLRRRSLPRAAGAGPWHRRDRAGAAGGRGPDAWAWPPCSWWSTPTTGRPAASTTAPVSRKRTGC